MSDRLTFNSVTLNPYWQSVYLVTLGTVVGHACCTAGAVIAGRYISSKIDVKYGMEVPWPYTLYRSDNLSPVTFAGATLFVLFGFIYTYEFFVDISAVPSPES